MEQKTIGMPDLINWEKNIIESGVTIMFPDMIFKKLLSGYNSDAGLIVSCCRCWIDADNGYGYLVSFKISSVDECYKFINSRKKMFERIKQLERESQITGGAITVAV